MWQIHFKVCQFTCQQLISLLALLICPPHPSLSHITQKTTLTLLLLQLPEPPPHVNHWRLLLSLPRPTLQILSMPGLPESWKVIIRSCIRFLPLWLSMTLMNERIIYRMQLQWSATVGHWSIIRQKYWIITTRPASGVTRSQVLQKAHHCPSSNECSGGV